MAGLSPQCGMADKMWDGRQDKQEVGRGGDSFFSC